MYYPKVFLTLPSGFGHFKVKLMVSWSLQPALEPLLYQVAAAHGGEECPAADHEYLRALLPTTFWHH